MAEIRSKLIIITLILIIDSFVYLITNYYWILELVKFHNDQTNAI